jgi:presequence protease
LKKYLLFPRNNSTGIPHILEHSVLCGSRKYPLKEPFVELLKGSLHTFLNAFTYPDRTCYPVASTNAKVIPNSRKYASVICCVGIIHIVALQDFYNLVDVYLDAVFFPKCVEDFQTFQQEGWHYELDNPEEEITFKGLAADSSLFEQVHLYVRHLSSKKYLDIIL